MAKEEIALNGIKCYIDFEAIKKQELFFEYREKLYELACSNGFLFDPSVVEKCDKYLFEHHKQYRQFINYNHGKQASGI